MTHYNLSFLYPDVDPKQPIPPTYSERFSLSIAAAVLAFGAAAGDLLVMAAGLALTLIAAIAPTLKTPRRVRNEARSRFPDAGWTEDKPPLIPLAISYPVTWLFIMAIVGAALWFVPTDYTLLGASIAAILTAVIVWFMPGLSPLWTPRDSETDDNLNQDIPPNAATFGPNPSQQSPDRYQLATQYNPHPMD